jgi:hypothetical protein
MELAQLNELLEGKSSKEINNILTEMDEETVKSLKEQSRRRALQLAEEVIGDDKQFFVRIVQIAVSEVAARIADDFSLIDSFCRMFKAEVMRAYVETQGGDDV